MQTIKTTVSIPTSLYERSEQWARRRGLPRSHMYAQALEHLVSGEENQITSRFNEVAALIDTSMDPLWAAAQGEVIRRQDH